MESHFYVKKFHIKMVYAGVEPATLAYHHKECI